MAILGEKISTYVSNQIIQRQKIQGSGFLNERNNQDILYLSNRNAWVKMASSVDLRDVKRANFMNLQEGQGGDKLAKRFVLFNSLSDYNNPNKRKGVIQDKNYWNSEVLYGFGGNSQGLTPPPGIENVEIQTLNRGSIRKAIVTIKAFNKHQFELLELLYVRLGYSMIIEWGWDKYIDAKGNLSNMGNTLINNEWFKNNSFEKILEIAEQYRKRYEGNYDAFIGRVTNFNWEFTGDGNYNITLDLITIGGVIESLKTSYPVGGFDVNEKPSTNGETVDELKQKAFDENPLISEINDLTTTNDEKKAYNSKKATFQKPKEIIKIIPDINSVYYKLGVSSNNKLAKTLLKLMHHKAKFQYSPTGPEPNSNTKIQIPFKAPTVVEDEILLLSPTEYLKENFTDPFFITLNGLLEVYKKYVLEDKDLKMSIKDNALYFKGFQSKDPTTCFINDGEVLKVNKNFKKFQLGETNLGDIGNIFINFKFIFTILEENLQNKNFSVYDFFEKIAEGINNSFGGLLNIEFIVFDDIIFTPIDQNRLIEDQGSPLINIMGYTSKGNSNFVKKVGFNTKITPNLATQITIGATADGTGTDAIETASFSIWNKGIVDRYNIESENNTNEIEAPIFGSNPNYVTQEEYNRHFDSSNTITPKIEYSKWWGFYGDSLFKASQNALSQGRALMIRAFNDISQESIKKGVSLNPLGFIPLSLNLDLDGISGMKIYNSLKISQEFLPKQYPTAFNFLITKISHRISDNNWETSLGTLSTSNIPKVKDIKDGNLKLIIPNSILDSKSIEAGKLEKEKLAQQIKRYQDLTSPVPHYIKNFNPTVKL